MGRRKYKIIWWNEEDFSEPIVIICVGKVVHEGTFHINTKGGPCYG